MSTTRMTASMKRSLEIRLDDLDRRIESLNAQREGDDGVEVAALLEQLTGERTDTADALRDAALIDDEPFDTEAIEIDEYEIGSGAYGDAPEVRPPQGRRTSNRRRGEELGGRVVGDRLGDGSGCVARDQQLLQEIVRVRVSPDADVHAGPQVAAERAQRDAAPHEHCRAMGDAGAAFVQQVQVPPRRPVQPRVLIEKDRVPENCALVY